MSDSSSSSIVNQELKVSVFSLIQIIVGAVNPNPLRRQRTAMSLIDESNKPGGLAQ